MQGKINKSAVEKLQPGELLADTEVKGFVARCLPSGNVTYGYRYRAAGTQRWLPLGSHGKVTAEQARKAAKMGQGKVAVGQDPAGAKQQARQDASNTVNALLDKFVEQYVRKECRSADQIERAFDRNVRPAIGTMCIYNLKRSDVMKMLDEIATRGPVMADSVVAFVGKAFNWWELRDERFRSPIIRGMRRCKPAERARKRTLDDQEIRDLWAACDLVKTPKFFGTLVKILLLTARRRKELAGITWDEIDRDNVWTCPAARVKTGKKSGDLVIPLSTHALALLGKRAPGFVFATGKRLVPFAGFDLATIELRRRMDEVRAKDGRPPAAHFTLHDLRRSARSLMSRAGVDGGIAELCLGHALKGVRATYDRYEYLNEKRDAFERLGEMVDRILDPTPANVLPLHQQRTSKAA